MKLYYKNLEGTKHLMFDDSKEQYTFVVVTENSKFINIFQVVSVYYQLKGVIGGNPDWIESDELTFNNMLSIVNSTI